MREFVLILPEVILAVTLAFVVVAELTYHGEQLRFVTVSTLLGLVAAFVQTFTTYRHVPVAVFSGAVSIDGVSLFFKLLSIALAGLSIVAASHSEEIPPGRRTEFSALVLAATLAMCLAASASDMLLIFLSLQLLNIVVFFIAGYGKRSLFSIEAGVKYLIFSGVAGVLLLYGLAVLFSITHSLNIYEAHRAFMVASVPRTQVLIIFMLIFLSLGSQVAGFPMYLWAPDVLEGAPTPASGFIVVATRMTGFAIAIRFLIGVFAQSSLTNGNWEIVGDFNWPTIVAVVSGITMLVGSFLALRQNRAKRMVGCLAITQSGFLLLGILVLDQVGVAALLYNLVIELFAFVGIFYILSYFYEQLHSDNLNDLRGMLNQSVPECICLVLFLLCLVGMPPAPGFIGKFTLIGAIVRHQWWGLATLAILSSALSTVAIARLAFHLIGDATLLKKFQSESRSFERKAFLVVLLVPMLLAGLFANSVLNWAGKSLSYILW
ncbi:MAG: NADH-quinone oxidoreductase subunit N [Oligoflexia bacterium]|nr:NADH-quinone oxidoreductase subunit N [Oligoflexia bacterium]